MRQILHVLIWLFFCTDMLVGQSLKSEFEQLQNDYASTNQAWHSLYDAVKTDDERIARFREWPGWSFAPRFIAFAEAAGSSQEGFESLLEVLKMGDGVGEFDQDLFEHYEKAIWLILAKHREKELRPICAQVRVSTQSENFLRTLMADSDSKELRAEACFRLGTLLLQRREACLPTSWAQRAPIGAVNEYIHARQEPNFDQFSANQDVEKLQSEALQCFQLVAADYPDVLTARGDEKLGVRARREIYELEHLAIGVAAPEIVGTGVDGQQMRLSDNRGKVVLLVFWASWCGPCMGDIPREKELHAKFAGRPFVIVGVNADNTLDSARDSVKENSIPWRSFWNGEDGLEGPIVTGWNVRGWPTTYILDHKGKIRFKQLRREYLNEPLEKLVKDAEASAGKQK